MQALETNEFSDVAVAQETMVGSGSDGREAMDERHACLSRQQAPPLHKSRGTRPGAAPTVPLPPNRRVCSICIGIPSMAPNANANANTQLQRPAAYLLSLVSTPCHGISRTHYQCNRLHWSDGRRHAGISTYVK